MDWTSSRASGRVLSRTPSRLAHPGSIRVFVRFKPGGEDGSCVEKFDVDSVRIRGQQYKFDKVFNPSSTQLDVFEAVKHTIEGVLEGYNGCVLAYGQTGAGKSHTMMGPHGKTLVGSEMGIIPRMVEHLFKNKPVDHVVKAGYLEVYNEKVRDLLGDGTDLKVVELATGGGFRVKGLLVQEVSTAQEVFSVMQRGDCNRSTAATHMNALSSRSHSIFLVDLRGPTTKSKLVLVDLAGSEKIAKTGATGTVLEEAANINRSLSSLGMVVNALASQSPKSMVPLHEQAQHVPFRDSKLTRILQDSLSGNSRTCLIVHCSPKQTHVNETVNSLRFGQRAQFVQTAPRVNFAPQQNVQHEVLVQQHIQLQQEHALLKLKAAQDSELANRAEIAHLEHEQLEQRQLELNRELYTALVAEQTRLRKQVQANAARLAWTRSHIHELESQLRATESRGDIEEDYLFTEIAILEPRINLLNAIEERLGANNES